MRTLVLLLATFSLAGAAPPQAPAPPQGPPVREEPDPFAPPTYQEQRALAIKQGKPLVVGVGCQPPHGAEWLCCEVASLPGYPVPCVVVCYVQGGGLYWRATLHCHATTAEIQAALFTVHPPVPRGTGSLPVGSAPSGYYSPPRFSYPQLGGFASCGPRG